MAAEPASFKTEMLSISSGLMELSALEVVVLEDRSPVVAITPSITHNGLELALIEPIPRMRISVAEPGAPEDEDDCSPATARLRSPRYSGA